MEQINSNEQLKELKKLLDDFMPGSVQVVNSLVLELLEDGVEREILLNKDVSKENVVVIVNDKSEKPRMKLLIFCYPEKNANLKALLERSVNFSTELIFWVSSSSCSTTSLVLEISVSQFSFVWFNESKFQPCGVF